MFQRFFVLAILGYCVSNGFAADRPNVLLIMVDDLRDYGGAFTKAVVKTPNLDRLRSRGTTFERAYVQYPVCNPSRCSMMTGMRAEQTGIVGNDKRLRENMPDMNGVVHGIFCVLCDCCFLTAQHLVPQSFAA